MTWSRKLSSLGTIVCLITCSQGFSVQLPVARTSGRSYVELIEPETGCQVILLGCLHGSTSSADDVRQLLSQETDAIVLELCASRMTDLRKVATPAPQQKSGLERYVNMVLKTYEKKGFGTASAAAVLGGVSVVQTAISDFDPGLEFLTAIGIAEQDSCDVILADRTVDETLRRVGQLPNVSWSMMQKFVNEGNWENSYGKDARVLQAAVFGDKTMESGSQVQMASVLTRSKAAMEDLVRLSVPPTIVSLLLANVVSDVLAVIFPEQAAVNPWFVLADVALTPQDVANVAFSVASEVFVQICTLFAGYVFLALPAARVILSERDDYLTKGIQAACRLKANDEKPGRIVAVLGLLHVNGVANQLLGGNDGTK